MGQPNISPNLNVVHTCATPASMPDRALEEQMVEQLSLEDLIAHTKEAIAPFRYSKSTLGQYDYAWEELRSYFISHDSSSFSVDLAGRFVDEAREKYEQGELKAWRFKLIRKATDLLVQFHENGTVQWTHLAKWGSQGIKEQYFIDIYDTYVQKLKITGYGEGTVEFYALVAKEFLKYLEDGNVKSLDQLTLKDVGLFISVISGSYQPTSMGTILSGLRSFTRFALQTGLTPSDLTAAIPKSFGRKTTLIPTITAKEEELLLAAVDRTTMVGKRDFAILLLALRLGLRSVDIIRLKLDDIKWRTDSISIIQQKTLRRLEVPLLTDVGNAIIDYLINGRPESNSPYVFVRSQAPYVNLSPRGGLYSLVASYMENAGVRQETGQRRGPHCLRHSLAARLLAGETPLPVISAVLGHANKDSTKTYLSTDSEHLRHCALGLEGIEVTSEALS